MASTPGVTVMAPTNAFAGGDGQHHRSLHELTAYQQDADLWRAGGRQTAHASVPRTRAYIGQEASPGTTAYLPTDSAFTHGNGLRWSKETPLPATAPPERAQACPGPFTTELVGAKQGTKTTLITTEDYRIVNIERQRQENESRQTRMLTQSPPPQSLNPDNGNPNLSEPPVLKGASERQCSSQEKLQPVLRVTNIAFPHARKASGKGGGAATSPSQPGHDESASRKSMARSRRASGDDRSADFICAESPARLSQKLRKGSDASSPNDSQGRLAKEKT